MAKKIPIIEDDHIKQHSIEQFKSIADTIELWQQLTHRMYADNTLVAFKNDWNMFISFCHQLNQCCLPASADVTCRFIEKMAQTRKLSSLKRYIVTIGLVHKCHALPNPCTSSDVKLAMFQQRMDKHDDYTQAQGFCDNHLQQLHTLFSSATKPKDVRDMAIWALTFEGMLKRSEVAALTVNDIEFIDNKSLITINSHLIELSELATEAVKKWLTLSLIETGFIFRRIDRHGNIGDNPLNHSSIYRVFRRASQELDLPVDVIFSGQSPRVGASQDLARSGLSVHQIQTQGRWKSPAMPAQYIGDRGYRDRELKHFAKKNQKDID
ncbi:TPA: tyrosine-type recombinase/integrase [Photobacterium damselae]|uniref:tyrosine-type recombinase/integrase n=1 Tax=Photobacterium damselae TaxID=38293 RepID=UPI0025429F9D